MNGYDADRKRTFVHLLYFVSLRDRTAAFNAFTDGYLSAGDDHLWI